MGSWSRSLGPNRELQRRFWWLIREGIERKRAAEALGLHGDTGKAWFRQAGGVVPAFVTAQPSGRFLSFVEREEIFGGIQRGESIRRIARSISRHPSTVSRELLRNSKPRYRPSLAQRRAEHRARRPKPAKLTTHPQLRSEVQAKLLEWYSPRQIAVSLRRRFPDQPEMWVSHEAIYKAIYVQGRGSLRRDLARALRTGRQLRHPRRRPQQRRPRIADMLNIRQRPPEVADRAVPGHWEGDLLIGRNNRSAIGTLVERATRFVMLLHLPNGHGPLEVQAAMIAATQRLPQFLWKSLTWDQGQEMRNHAQITIATGLEIYFCDPGKPWQRGSNENTNGLLRQYFPKGTDLTHYGPEYLEFVAAQLNRRPRETLGWLHPAEALDRLFSTEPEQVSVAPTD
jgi:transposase, IS30 family